MSVNDVAPEPTGRAVLPGLIAIPGSAAVDPERRRWLAVADEVADRLASDVLARDRANHPPFAEVELLRSSGLLGLRIPTECGGAGQDLSTTVDVLRRIARVDGSIAHLLGYHYNFGVGSIADAPPEVAARLWRDTIAQGWCWAGTGSPQDVGLVLEPDGPHDYRLSGRKSFATGSRVADRLLGFVRNGRTGHPVVVVLDPTREQLVRRDDWDVLGQRLSASNGLELTEYRITERDIVIDYGPDGEARPPWQTLGVLFSQLLFSQLCQGIAEGALLQARDYTRSVSRPWFHAEVDRAVDDPYILGHYGELVSRVQAVDALNARATDSLEWAYGRGEQLGAVERGQVSEVIATSRVVANEVALDVAARVFDVTGARATDSRYGLDLAWRNIRTLTLHDPQSHKIAEVGRYFLNDTLPSVSPYR